MTPKLKLKLNLAQLQALNAHLFQTLTSQPIEDLRYYPQDFLICSTLQELYAKTSARVEDIRLFPTRRTDVEYPVTLTRSQALAVYCSILTEKPQSDEMASQTMTALAMTEPGTYESHFLQELHGTIHRKFLI
ncbi:hypothetical protein [Spirosoma aerolatum]|uniref:hypothetical protein n=1 Tax=Spirosoma aerolatum TaxID=1211326 RepID=UPI0009AEA18E|nr:hypothetical protein [Spirosoma aerolatum]